MALDSSSSNPAALLTALVAPAAIVGLALAWLGRVDPEAAAAADAPEVKACLETMDKGDDVVLVGNSKSGTDIDRPALAKALGVTQIAKLGAPGSSAPLWYAAVERCAYEAGHTPRLVIVYGVAGAMLRTTMDSELERLLLAPYLGADEPVLDAKVFGGASSPFWSRVRTRKTTLVLGLQHGVRDLVAGLFFAPPGEGTLLERGRATAEPALAQVLGEAAGEDATTQHRAIPIAEGDAAAAGPARTVADTLIPDLVALATAHGSRIVFVQAPLAASKAATYDKADPALVRDMVAALNAAGAGFVDLTTLDLPASAYGDGIHMNANGRARLTTALAERLRGLDALTAGSSFAAALLPRAPAVIRREGAPPSLPALGAPTRGPQACGWTASLEGLDGASDTVLGRAGLSSVSPIRLFEDGAPLAPHATKEAFDLACAGGFSHQSGMVKFSPTGGPAEVVATRTYTVALSDAVPLQDPFGRDAWWVYPGTTLVVEAPDGWDPPLDGFGVAVATHVAIPGAGAATVRVGGVSAPLTIVETVGTATVHAPSPAGPWRVEVASPADGPWLLVRSVVAGTDAAPWYALGTPDEGRVVSVLKGSVTYDGAPPAIGALGRVFPTKGGGWRVETTDLGAPNGDTVYRATGISACSPIRLLEDGAPLAQPNAPVRLVPTTAGAWAHTAFGVLFSTSDLTSPLANGRAYTAALNPERPCRTGRWLYPGDHATFAVPDNLLGRLAEGATRLDLTANAFGGDTSAALTVRVRVGDAELLSTTTAVGGLDAAPPRFSLTTPVPRDAKGVVVELSTPPGAPFVMVTGLDLIEPPKPIF